MQKEIPVPIEWLKGLQKQAARVEKSLARTTLKSDPYINLELKSLFGYLDSIDYLINLPPVK